ncbi:MAG TPA: DNA translocase FtsK [Planctomycetota bacterium]|nr:DNA translocase FtsK [Planctomycetota bacterium]
MNRPLRLLIALLLAGGAVALLVALISYAPAQVAGASPSGVNLLGGLGAHLAHGLIGIFGIAAFLPPVVLVAMAGVVASGVPWDTAARRLTGSVLLMLVAPALVHLLPLWRWSDRLQQHWDQQQLAGLGGALGYYLCGPVGNPADPAYGGGLLVRQVDTGVAALVLIVAAVGCLALIDLGLVGLMRRAWRAFVDYQPSSAAPEPSRRLTPAFAEAPAIPKARTTTSIKEITRRLVESESIPADAEDLVARIRERRRAIERGESGDAQASPAVATTSSAPVAAPAPVTARPDTDPPSEDDDATAEEAETSALAEPTPPPVAAPAPPPAPKKKAAPRRPEVGSGYHLPPVDLLEEVPGRRATESELEKIQTGKAIEEVFSHFAISVKVVAARRGPVITMYEIQLLDNAMRVNKVEGFEKDLSLKLGTEGIRIVAPLPNKKTIGIEVPNKVKEAVVMRDLVEQIDAASMTLPLILGRDVVGNPMVGDLAKMPHLLVAGATGTGKSVCMNAMICSVLLFRGPDEVKFIMVDPKMVELAGYEDIPHLLAPPITDMTKAHAALEWACRTMDERYFALRLVGVRDIKAYNDLGEEEIRTRLAKKGKSLDDLPGMQIRLPYIVVLVDEYADLMMVNKEVEKSIIRLCQKSRAAGIHVILTTQRPSADVVTGLIKSNLPARICFRVADKNNSRVVLDAGGAENLLGRGDMLFLPPGMNSLVRGQGVWVKDKEIEAIIEHAKSQGEPQYDESIVSLGAVAMVGGGSSGEAKTSEWLQDRQFHEAVQSMYRYNRTGADFFRRKLNVGYNKATAFVEMLEDLAFLGPQKGTAAREILKSWDDWIELLKANGLTWEEDDELYHNPVEIRS